MKYRCWRFFRIYGRDCCPAQYKSCRSLQNVEKFISFILGSFERKINPDYLKIDLIPQTEPTSKDINMGIEVFLNIYDLSSINCVLHPMGIGAYHSAIQIKNSEFCYGAFQDEECGILEIEPRSNKYVIFRKTMCLGLTDYSLEEIADVIEKMKPDYKSVAYDIFKKNCNTFSEEFAKNLLKNIKIPNYMTRLTRIFQCFRCCLSKAYISGGVLNVNNNRACTLKGEQEENEGTPKESDTKSQLIESAKKTPPKKEDYRDFKRGKVVPIDVYEPSLDLEKQNTLKSQENNHKIYNTEEVA